LQLLDIEEVIDIVKDGGDSLRPQCENDLPDANDDEHQDLRTRLLNARVEASGGQHFLSPPTVERILSEERVREELGQKRPEASSQKLDELVRQICRQPGSSAYLRVFSILVLTDRLADIDKFIQAGLSDKDLPLSEQQLQKAFEDTAHANKSWAQEALERFSTQQWELCSPYFSSSSLDKVRFYDLDENTIMPWTVDGSKSSTGGYASVYKVQIHPSHHGFTNQNVCHRFSRLKTRR
jgi:hypothetical protein